MSQSQSISDLYVMDKGYDSKEDQLIRDSLNACSLIKKVLFLKQCLD